MHTKARTEALVTHLEVVLRRLETESGDYPGSCCVCLQRRSTMGHLPSCYLAKALKEIETWREEVAKDDPVSLYWH